MARREPASQSSVSDTESHAFAMAVEPNSVPPMDRRFLHGFEHISVPIVESLHRHQGLHRALHACIGTVDAWLVETLIGRTWEVHDLEPLLQLQAPCGMILVSNHRSFFDMFVISTLVNRRSRLMKRVTYPVRSEYFYDHPMGLLLNLLFSGGAMWPPVFRDDRRRQLNPTGLDQLASTLTAGMAIGIHPEGKRGQGPDPYSFLPLKPGLGQLLQRCPPETWIVPVFIAGLSSSAAYEIRRNFRPEGQRGETVRIRFGRALTVANAREAAGDAMGLTEHIMTHVRALGEVDRRERQA